MVVVELLCFNITKLTFGANHPVVCQDFSVVQREYGKLKYI
jgi:hypothetical protein